MATQSYQLVFRSGPNPGKAFDLSSSEITLGRESSNDIVINDAEVSRKHARLLLQLGGYMIEDLGSTNGTFVNGQRLVGPRSLQNGDMILFGENVSMSYEKGKFDPDATVIGVPPVYDEAQDIPAVPAVEPEDVEPAPRYTQMAPQAYEREQPPAYDEPVPSGSAVYEEPVPGLRKRSAAQNWLLAGCGCLIIVCCILVGIVFILDQLNMLCDPLFRPFTNLVLSIANPIFGLDYYCPPVFP